MRIRSFHRKKPSKDFLKGIPVHCDELTSAILSEGIAVEILLVPGFMQDAGLWKEVEQALQDHGNVVHADLTKDQYPHEMVERLLAEISGPVVIVAFAFGAAIARFLAEFHPDKVLGIVLVSTPLGGIPHEAGRRKRDFGSSLAEAMPSMIYGLEIYRTLESSRFEDRELADEVREMAERIGSEVYKRQQHIPALYEPEDFASGAWPVLIVAGEGDQTGQLDGIIQLQNAIPGAELAVVTGAGHLVPLEAPQAFADVLLNWLKKHRNRFGT